MEENRTWGSKERQLAQHTASLTLRQGKEEVWETVGVQFSWWNPRGPEFDPQLPCTLSVVVVKPGQAPVLGR